MANYMISSSSSDAAAKAIVDDVIIKEYIDDEQEEEDDDCSICLEPFSSNNPPTVTKCNHDYHLHCILEWSQRSKECPICWRILVLNDPSSQELLAAAASERNARIRCRSHQIHEVHEVDHVGHYVDDSDFEERILRHFAAATSRSQYFHPRRRQTYSGIRPSQILPSVPVADSSNLQQLNSSTEEYSRGNDTFSYVESPTAGTYSSTSSVFPSIVYAESSTANSSDAAINSRILLGQPPTDSSQRSSSSELLALKESIKSKFSFASARCKESISKSTNGFKEKLLARNNTVKELSREVQREMSAGIAGVARMIDRLDLTSKRTGASVPLEETSNSEKIVQENIITQPSSGNVEAPKHDLSYDVPPFVSHIVPCHPEVPRAQSRQ